MSIAFRTQRPKKLAKSNKPTLTAPSARPHRPAEAPDRGFQHREAPEGRMSRHEAPDAGEGRLGLIEGEFTHGRSQS